jgi:uncharacterized protein (DUF1501 family)
MQHHFSIDRRGLLIASFGALGSLVLSRAARAQGAEAPPAHPPRDPGLNLVLVQLSGGNDGLSMVVPWADDAYNKARTSTRIGAGEVLKLDDYRGLHPELKGLRSAWDAGALAIVEGCSYPKPNRSHFQSYEIWHTASMRGRDAGDGWIGRLCAETWPTGAVPELVVHVGANAPYSLHSTRHPAVILQNPNAYKWISDEAPDRSLYRDSGGKERPADSDALRRLRGILDDATASSLRVRKAVLEHSTKAGYAEDDFSQSLRVAGALLGKRTGTRVVSVELGGFDTHTNQRTVHDARMRILDAGLKALRQDLAESGADKHTVVLVFSEFGRRVQENGSRGTDHGVAAPMLLLGAPVSGGLHGKHPSLTQLSDGDLAMTTDFRSVYAALAEGCFGASGSRVLCAQYPQLGLLKA